MMPRSSDRVAVVDLAPTQNKGKREDVHALKGPSEEDTCSFAIGLLLLAFLDELFWPLFKIRQTGLFF